MRVMGSHGREYNGISHVKRMKLPGSQAAEYPSLPNPRAKVTLLMMTRLMIKKVIMTHIECHTGHIQYSRCMLWFIMVLGFDCICYGHPKNGEDVAI